MRAESERGEVVLRRRDHDGALELRVNGAFVMDDQETGTERALARLALEAVQAGSGSAELRALVAGLGLGCTLAEVLADPRVGTVLVVDVEPALVQWHRDGLIPGSEAAVGDRRVALEVADIVTLLPQLGNRAFDVLLLDVDNGPEFLVYESNSALYGSSFLQDCRRVLAPGGVLAVWSSTAADSLAAELTRVFGDCRAVDLPVRLGARASTYRILLAIRDDRHPQPADG